MVKKWTQEETDELVRLVECSWDWHFPGWWQMAHSLNSDFKNNRSISACYQKYSRYIESLRPKQVLYFLYIVIITFTFKNKTIIEY